MEIYIQNKQNRSEPVFLIKPAWIINTNKSINQNMCQTNNYSRLQNDSTRTWENAPVWNESNLGFLTVHNRPLNSNNNNTKVYNNDSTVIVSKKAFFFPELFSVANTRPDHGREGGRNVLKRLRTRTALSVRFQEISKSRIRACVINLARTYNYYFIFEKNTTEQRKN